MNLINFFVSNFRIVFGILCILIALNSSFVLAASNDLQSLSCQRNNYWDLWEHYKKTFMQEDGRVIDYATPIEHSTSEGQSYAMMFAL
jgi:endoglucanase